MKYINCRLLLMIFLVLFFLVGCSKEQLDYIHYEQMDEITIEGSLVTIVLYENQALPYRWEYEISGTDIELLEDKSVDDDSFSLHAGVSDSYRVFIFNCMDETEGQILIKMKSLNSEDEITETRVYNIAYVDGALTCNGFSK